METEDLNVVKHLSRTAREGTRAYSWSAVVWEIGEGGEGMEWDKGEGGEGEGWDGMG